MPRTQDLAIFVAMTTDRWQTKPIALPLAHAHGVTMTTDDCFIPCACTWGNENSVSTFIKLASLLTIRKCLSYITLRHLGSELELV